MFKPMFGNSYYYINEKGIIKDRDMRECTLDKSDVKEGNVRLSINGHTRVCCKKWLWLMSLYEVELPDHLKKSFECINFLEINVDRRLFNSDHLMEFRAPLYYNSTHRIVPGYTRYAVSKEGSVIEWKTQRELNICLPTSDKNYPSVSIYDPIAGKVRSVGVHRLVALAWVTKRPTGAFIVNHKSGDKSNYHYRNLEWVTTKENNTHAVITRLRKDTLPTRVRDFETGIVSEHPSLTAACSFMGVSQKRALDFTNFIRPGKLINNRYELRVEGDNRPWVYSENDTVKRHGRYIITAKLSDTDTRTYYDRRDFQKDLKIWNVPNIKEAIKKAAVLYPAAEFHYKDLFETRPVQMLNAETGIITEHPTIMEISRLIGEHKTVIRKALLAGEHQLLKGYAFRYKTSKPWTKELIDTQSKSVCIQARHKPTGKILEFDSLRKLAEYFNKDRSVFKMRLRTGKDFEGWTFSEM